MSDLVVTLDDLSSRSEWKTRVIPPSTDVMESSTPEEILQEFMETLSVGSSMSLDMELSYDLLNLLFLFG